MQMSEGESGNTSKRPYQDQDPRGIPLGGILEGSSSESETDSVNSEAKGLTESGRGGGEGANTEKNISSKKRILLQREATITAEINELNKKLKKDPTVDKLRQEADESSIVEQLIRTKKKLSKLENDRKVLLKDNSALRESLRRSKEKELSHLTESEFKAEVAKGGSFRYSKLTFSLKANINL